MTDIFINYRRDDSGGRTDRLAAALGQALGPAHVVRDIADSIPAEDVAEAIDSHLHSVDVVLVVIGPNWLLRDGSGRLRLETPGDLVCAEIRVALAAGKPVWPVLVGGTTLPAADDLPAAISGLARRPIVVLDDSSWSADVARLVKALQPRQAPATVRRSGLWELTATACVLVATLLIGDAWIEREVAQRSATVAAAAGVADAGQPGSRWRAELASPLAAHDALFAVRQEGVAVVGIATHPGQPHSVEDGRLAANGPLPLLTRAEALVGDSRKALPQQDHKHPEGGGIYVMPEKADGKAASPPLSFVGWRSEP